MMSSCCCGSSVCNNNSSSDENNDSDLCCSLFNCTKSDLIKSGFYRTKLFDNIICCGCGWQSGDIKITISHLNFLHKLHNPDCKMSKHIAGDFCNYSKYKKCITNIEDAMLDTFKGWPKLYPNVQELVKAGFYYTGSGDSVACISCGIVLEDWNSEDRPYDEHRKSSPFCELIKK